MLIIFLFILLFLAVGKKIFFWTALWQTKEYRWDRMRVHLSETRQGKSLFTSYATLIGTLLVALYIFVILFDWFTPFFQIFVVTFFLLYIFDFAKQIVTHKVKRPVWTYKSDLIIALSLLSTFVLFLFPLTDRYLWSLILLGLIPLVVGIWVGVFSFPSEIYTDYLSQKAQKKIKSLKNLRVIGVSGSYGKSSTKEALAHILSQKFSVVKTPLSNNTPIGIAKTILRSVNEETQFFIVEMGAYKKGELAQICSIVRPDISITTAVSDQHISLYGSWENIIASEKEVIHALPKDGIALFNANNPQTASIAKKTRQEKFFYQTADSIKSSRRNTIIGFDCTTKTDGTLFSINYNNVTMHMKTHLLGEHVVENILPGILLGIRFGLSEKEIQKAVITISPLPHTMQKHILTRGIIAIDDSFNASPESVAAAAKYLSLYTKKKYIVLTPLIELGKNAKERHIVIGKLLGHIDYIFVTNKNYYHEIAKGIQEVHGKAILIYHQYEEIANMIQHFAQKGDCVLFEGKEAGVVLKKLL